MTPIRPILMSLYPTKDSLEEAVAYAQSVLPNSSVNDIFSILMTYHNTMLTQLALDGTERNTCITNIALEGLIEAVAEAARDEGYAIVWWSPEDLGDADPDHLTDILQERASKFI